MKKNRINIIIIIILIIFGLSSIYNSARNTNINTIDLTYSEFYQQLETSNVENLKITLTEGAYSVEGTFRESYQLSEEEKQLKIIKIDEANKFTSTVPIDTTIIQKINKQIEKNDVTVTVEKYKQPINFLSLTLTLLFIFGIFTLLRQLPKIMKSQDNVMNFSKSRAKKILNSSIKFTDVAGYQEEKQELIEIVDFLKDPTVFKEMGARVPKGVLLVGPPGTGKTLLAKAVAGEAGVNFIMQSGSEFEEMLVGVGASRARKLFEDAKKNVPCILFIDEIDAVGKKRNGLTTGNSTSEQTLNQILIEMDGFVANTGIVVVAATNRADVLDPALLRPGRFDRQVQVNLPNLKEREEILKLHMKKRKVVKEIDVSELSKNTAGFSGAQLENVINEAAIVAVRENKKEIDKNDVSEAIDRVLMGPAKKTRKYTQEDKELISYHETGHVIVGLELEEADVIQKVTIIPRGNAGGYASFAPKEDRFNYTKNHLLEKITGLLGGRAAEEVMLQEQTAGAHNDFERATKIARSMVVEYGMSDLGIYQYQLQEDSQPGYIAQRYSEKIAAKIDNEINKILDTCYEKAKEIITSRKDEVEKIAQALIEKETLERPDIDYLLENGTLPEEKEIERYTTSELEELHEKAKKEEQEKKAMLKEIEKKIVEKNKKTSKKK